LKENNANIIAIQVLALQLPQTIDSVYSLKEVGIRTCKMPFTSENKYFVNNI
jgi:hypothetical protein